MIRASVPVLVALIAICVESKVPSKAEIVCLVIISLGVMLAVWEESKNALIGIILTVVSTVMQSFQMSISGRLMSGAKSAAGGGLDSFQAACRELPAPAHARPPPAAAAGRPPPAAADSCACAVR